MNRTCAESIDYLTVFTRLNDELSLERESVDRIQAILELAGSVPDICGVELLLYHREMNLLYPHQAATKCEAWGLNDTKQGLGSVALKELSTQYLPDISESGVNGPFPGAKSLLSIPLIASGNIHGVLNIGSSETDRFGSEDITILQTVGAFLAQILENVNLGEMNFDLQRRLIETISAQIDELDPTYAGHAGRVSSYAVAIAEQMKLDKSVITDIERSGYLHDIGKVGVSSGILTKPGKLTEDEFNEVKMHTIHSRFLLTPLGFMPRVLEGIASHHERWDGEGYPKGLKGDEIPIEGRILAVAEVLDVLTTDQNYREKMTPRQALKEIKTNSGGQFDPDVVDALCKAVDGGLDGE